MMSFAATIDDLHAELESTRRSLATEKSFGGAHKNEIKKGQVALAEVGFQWKSPDLLVRNPDFRLKIG